ncbi:23S rRNA (adenine(2503)-C(2))-methyltransferase RlmN [Thermocrinis minervae]|uniref:Probable dual-specificity RNA methyltransferase RlmN n=1 Tax=Thermocrinis minervae TaxID=381751 RepID=A0A1M6TM55_9AQUI|nr:23S rRNA (adenine(2503)-C(2))-methyltransferase RlmN [Thermocrinis minervae]SHK58075.1 23S rRNA m(2)A-2503 methyltransferase [Thermocrinis minervae]
MKSLLSFTLEELKDEVKALGWEEYRASQILNWLYKKFETDFDRMTNLSKEHRQKLKELYTVHTLTMVGKVPASDSTKYLFKTHDGHIIETVLIRERDHLTLCVSSQVGCAVGCTFCATALDGLKRNLTTEEIVDQFLQVQRDIPERIRNVVFMGMGEPLANYENVRKAVSILVSPWGVDLSKRRVSISTSGLIAQLRRMAQDPLMRELNLAVSINATTQSQREILMPITKTNTLEELFNTLKEFPYPPDRRIMLEYVLIEGVNDTKEDAIRLANLIGRHKKKFKVNLIPYNPDPILPYRRPTMDRVYTFQKVLWDKGISAFIRISKGIEVFGACGQLRIRRHHEDRRLLDYLSFHVK